MLQVATKCKSIVSTYLGGKHKGGLKAHKIARLKKHAVAWRGKPVTLPVLLTKGAATTTLLPKGERGKLMTR